MAVHVQHLDAPRLQLPHHVRDVLLRHEAQIRRTREDRACLGLGVGVGLVLAHLELAQVDLGAAEEKRVVLGVVGGRRVRLVRHAQDLGVEVDGVLDGANGQDDVVEGGERAGWRRGGGDRGGGGGRMVGGGSEMMAGSPQYDGRRAAEEQPCAGLCGEGGERAGHGFLSRLTMLSGE